MKSSDNKGATNLNCSRLGESIWSFFKYGSYRSNLAIGFPSE